MGRIHLFEFEDQEWFPRFLRSYGTDYLRFLEVKMKIFQPVIPIIVKALDAGNTKVIVDLGSGSGGPLVWLNDKIKKKVPGLKIILTDYYPNLPAFSGISETADNFSYHSEPVDARNVPKQLPGLRTLILTFHHFKRNDARKILQDAIDSSHPIAIFEGQERSVFSLLAMLFSPLTVLFTTPFIRPFRIKRIIFTYLIPIVPLFVLWDGIVSSLRTYSIKEMKALVKELQNNDFDWETGRLRSGPGTILYMIGLPKN
ncbi:MAG: hypothetical protein R3214_13965 [Christiangramia sp.]|nr:hypothetical protein [Christiangramia sp.]